MAQKFSLAVLLSFFLIAISIYLTGAGIALASPDFKIFPDTVTQVETSIAIHPLNPQILAGAAVTDIYPGGYTTGVYISSNGGVNWTGTHCIRDSTGAIITTLGNPKVMIDKNGTILVSFVAPSPSPGGRDYKIGVSYSTNNGLYWSRLIYIPGVDTADKSVCATDFIPASPYYGRSYVAYNERRGIYFSSSTNGGKNWTVAKQISPPVYYIRTGASIAVGPMGIIYVSWPYLKDTQKYIGVARSTNGGQTWDSSDTSIPVNPLKGDFRININSVKLHGLPNIAVDYSGGSRNGWTYVVSSERPASGSPAVDSCDLVLRCSTNNGVSWPLKYKVNQDTGPLKYQLFSSIDVDKTGAINIIYFDTRSTPTRDSFEVYISRSTNGGQTFKDTLISGHKFKLKQLASNKWLFGIPSYIGTGIGLCSTENKLFPLWYDNSYNDEYLIWTRMIEYNVSSYVKAIPEAFYNLSTGKLNSRDTVKCYLRNSLPPYNRIDSSKGIMDSVTFETKFNFSNAITTNYFVEISHRNCIDTWSKFPVSYSASTGMSYNFTDSATKAYGNNLIQKGDKWCMYSGDVYKDGVIDPTDLMMIDNDAGNFELGYLNTDVNGDKVVDSSDLLITDNNAYNFVIIASP